MWRPTFNRNFFPPVWCDSGLPVLKNPKRNNRFAKTNHNKQSYNLWTFDIASDSSQILPLGLSLLTRVIAQIGLFPFVAAHTVSLLAFVYVKMRAENENMKLWGGRQKRGVCYFQNWFGGFCFEGNGKNDARRIMRTEANIGVQSKVRKHRLYERQIIVA